jgi:hypothetical protein
MASRILELCSIHFSLQVGITDDDSIQNPEKPIVTKL